jgi:hypothetical protein
MPDFIADTTGLTVTELARDVRGHDYYWWYTAPFVYIAAGEADALTDAPAAGAAVTLITVVAGESDALTDAPAAAATTTGSGHLVQVVPADANATALVAGIIRGVRARVPGLRVWWVSAETAQSNASAVLGDATTPPVRTLYTVCWTAQAAVRVEPVVVALEPTSTVLYSTVGPTVLASLPATVLPGPLPWFTTLFSAPTR